MNSRSTESHRRPILQRILGHLSLTEDLYWLLPPESHGRRILQWVSLRRHPL